MGVVAALRFLNQFRAGAGNYTSERGQWLDELSLNQIAAEIKGRRRKVRRRRPRFVSEWPSRLLFGLTRRRQLLVDNNHQLFPNFVVICPSFGL